ncbi:MAG: hypothetical protein MZV63_28815 [Marinilabiliales bacterium]|nr:hypothetical protein [Marinilabiliales bacterium]
MKKTSTPKTLKDLQAEYRFDCGQTCPNRFAEKLETAPLVVALDPDVAEIFTTPESVNAALRERVQCRAAGRHCDLLLPTVTCAKKGTRDRTDNHNARSAPINIDISAYAPFCIG